jgi:diguanylate cyclase (GGDEF)-like protein/PAS domain S-box-containing protein
VESVMREALIESRQRYKDFVDISSEMAWETDREGCFAFVSRGILGWSTADILGRPATALVDPDRSDGDVFCPRGRVEAEIWWRRPEGGSGCLAVRARPVMDGAGRWLGARGVARDISDLVDRERALAHARHRADLSAHVARALREEANPKAALDEVLTVLARAADAEMVAVLRQTGPEWRLLAACGDGPELLPDMAWLADGAGLAGHGHAAPGHAAPGPALARIRHRGETTAVLAMRRAAVHGSFSEEAVHLLSDVADRLGVVLSQIEQIERIASLSLTDPLTGLLNRRAFRERLEQELRRLKQSGGRGALAYVDLDNFKAVNDRLGHAAGDDLLRSLAAIMRLRVRPEDLVARIGGDEFVIWMSDVASEVAVRRMEELVQASREALEWHSADPDHPLGLSLGLVLCDPERLDTADKLLADADKAMYQAKRAGKGRLHIFSAAVMGTEAVASETHR